MLYISYYRCIYEAQVTANEIFSYFISELRRHKYKFKMLPYKMANLHLIKSGHLS